MEYAKIISTAMKIHRITKLNTYVVDSKGVVVYPVESIIIPAFMPGSQEEDILYFYKNIQHQEQLHSFINDWDLHYLGYSFGVETGIYTIIIGPYFDKTPNVNSLSREYHLSSLQSEDLRMISEKIYVLTAEQANSFASVLHQFKAMAEQDLTLTIIGSVKNNNPMHKKEENHHLEEGDELVHLRYKIEKDFMHAVELGDKTAALKLINSKNVLFYFSERFPNQPLRRLKNIAIILNTLLRTAARNSHVPAIFLHRISEKYAFDIENTNQLAVLHQLEDRMIEEYCDLVITSSLRNFSSMTQRVIEYLLNFYNKPIDKEELAAHLSTHPSHLSRKFKEETNMTITAYQQMLRMKQAKHLLSTENLSIEEIAWVIGYEDPSYFARAFKKETGMTPSQYRRKGSI